MNIINYLQNHLYFFLCLMSILGLCVGSFINVIIYRLPLILKNNFRKECLLFLQLEAPISSKIFNLLLPKSHCPKCNHILASWHNIPILSFILLRGKCANCKQPIPWRYPMVELLSGIATLMVAYRFGVTGTMLAALLLTWTLIPLIFIDMEHQILPDNLMIPLLWLGLLLNVKHVFTTPQEAIIGATTGYCSLWIVAYVFKLLRKVEGMGHGDFKLLAVFGAWFGWQILPQLIFFASLLGAIAGITLVILKKHEYSKAIPFGPFIAITGWSLFMLQPNYNFFRFLI